MKLYYSSTSPYVRKCLVAAHELGLAGRVELAPVVHRGLGLGPRVGGPRHVGGLRRQGVQVGHGGTLERNANGGAGPAP